MERQSKDPKELRRTMVPLEIREKASDDGTVTRTVTGVIKYNSESEAMSDWYGDKFVEEIAAGAFDESLKVRGVKALWSHRTEQVLGSTKSSTLRLSSDQTGLSFEMDLPNTTAGNDAYESIKRGDVDGVSFGMIPTKDKWSVVERDTGKIYKRSILQADLYEISPTAFPAYPANEVACRSLDDFRAEQKRQTDAQKKRMLTLELELI